MRADQIKTLQDKTIDLLFWFMERNFPPVPFELRKGETCVNCERMVFVALETLEAYADNPFSKPYVAAYLRLNALKNHIQNEATKQVGGKRKKLQSPANSGH